MREPFLSADLEQLLVVRRQAGRYAYPNQALKRRLRRCRQAGGYAAMVVESTRRVPWVPPGEMPTQGGNIAALRQESQLSTCPNFLSDPS